MAKNKNYNKGYNKEVEAKDTAIEETTEESPAVETENAVEETVDTVTEETTKESLAVETEDAAEEAVEEVKEDTPSAVPEVEPIIEAPSIPVTEIVPEKDQKPIEHVSMEQVEQPAPAITTAKSDVNNSTRTFGAGQKVFLSSTPVYATDRSNIVRRIGSAAYFIFNGNVSNGRIQISTKQSSDKKYVAGWVNINSVH